MCFCNQRLKPKSKKISRENGKTEKISFVFLVMYTTSF